MSNILFYHRQKRGQFLFHVDTNFCLEGETFSTELFPLLAYKS